MKGVYTKTAEHRDLFGIKIKVLFGEDLYKLGLLNHRFEAIRRRKEALCA